MDLIGSLLIQFGMLTAALWGFLQFLPASKKGWNYKLWLSFVLGPVFGVIGQGIGAIDLSALVQEAPSIFNMSPGVRNTAAAAFLGFLSTVLSKLGHDYIVNPAIDKMKQPPAGE